MTADVYSDEGYHAVIPEWILDAEVGAQAIRLYAVLRRYADQRTGHAHPGRKTLATRMQVRDVKTVDRALAELERLGAVVTFPRFVGLDGTISRVRDAAHPEQTSNGYVVRGRFFGEGGPTSAMTPPPSDGGTVAPQNGDEPQPLEPQPSEPQKSDSARRKSPPSSPTLAAFEAFWNSYPRRTGKAAAVKAWAKLPADIDHAAVIAGARAYRDDPNREAGFTKHPATWLNAGCWDDEPLPARRQSGAAGNQQHHDELFAAAARRAAAAESQLQDLAQLGAALENGR